MYDLVALYNKYPHLILYWVFLKSSFRDIEDWAEDVEYSFRRPLINVLVHDKQYKDFMSAALNFYRTYQIK